MIRRGLREAVLPERGPSLHDVSRRRAQSLAPRILTSQGFALISLRDMGVEEVRSQESEWRRQWRQPRRKREQNSRFCGHNGLDSILSSKRTVRLDVVG